MGIAQTLNRDCQCICVDRGRLVRELKEGLPDGDSSSLDLQGLHQRLFADSPVFVARRHVETIHKAVAAIHRTTASARWWQAVVSELPENLAEVETGRDSGAAGAMMSADFHLSEHGPRLIEINTNVGGALLALHQARAQKACCEPVARESTGQLELVQLENDLVAMFRREHALEMSRSQNCHGEEKVSSLRTVAIVDAAPEGQFLHPEMQLFASLMARHGIDARVVDPVMLIRKQGRVWIRGEQEVDFPVDLVYNRMTDFYLEDVGSQVLFAAWLAGEVAVTPNPCNYARFADKRRLPLLLNEDMWDAADLDEEQRGLLQEVVPPSVVATPELAEGLWADRKSLFFKPVSGYGSRGAFSGKKITRRVFQAAIDMGALAQQRIPPSERTLLVDGELRQLKVDLRAIFYGGVVQFLMARLYRGQTTNLRTEGGGLATVFAVSDGPLRAS